jgi:hypothetical protein
MCKNYVMLESSSPDTQDEVVGGGAPQASNPFMLNEKRHRRMVQHFMVTWYLTNCCKYLWWLLQFIYILGLKHFMEECV